MTTRSYSDLSDSATTFDPEEQFDRDIDERMKGMSKEEAVARAIRESDLAEGHCLADDTFVSFLPAARAAIAAADKWDAEQGKCNLCESSNGHHFSCVTIQRDYIDGSAAISGNSQSLGISSGAIGSFQPQPALNQDAMDAETARRGIKSSLALSPGLDSAIQDELDHPPASIMEERK
jgi:hypothetical protein